MLAYDHSKSASADVVINTRHADYPAFIQVITGVNVTDVDTVDVLRSTVTHIETLL